MSESEGISATSIGDPSEAVVSWPATPTLHGAVTVDPNGSVEREIITGSEVKVYKESTMCQRHLRVRLNRLPESILKLVIKDGNVSINKPFNREAELGLYSELDIKCEPEHELKQEPPDAGEATDAIYNDGSGCIEMEQILQQDEQNDNATNKHKSKDDVEEEVEYQANADPTSADLKLKTTFEIGTKCGSKEIYNCGSESSDGVTESDNILDCKFTKRLQSGATEPIRVLETNSDISWGRIVSHELISGTIVKKRFDFSVILIHIQHHCCVSLIGGELFERDGNSDELQSENWKNIRKRKIGQLSDVDAGKDCAIHYRNANYILLLCENGAFSEAEAMEVFTRTAEGIEFMCSKQYIERIKNYVHIARILVFQESIKQRFERAKAKYVMDNENDMTDEQMDKCLNTLEDLLTWNKIDHEKFARVTFKHLQRQTGKKNNLFFIGQPSTGKTMLMDDLAGGVPL
ncbi:parvovirus non-structural protein NS1 domain-containing protein [Phthorimaea operculella]|nr:parvovirus non-structural protein NS1 domain-containing protein [Phthorimaea operculella]